MFGSNYEKLFEKPNSFNRPNKNKPPNGNVARKTYSLHKIPQEKTSPKKSRTRHNRTLHFAYAMTNLKIYLSSCVRSLSRATRGHFTVFFTMVIKISITLISPKLSLEKALALSFFNLLHSYNSQQRDPSCS